MTSRPPVLTFGPISQAAPGPLYEQVVAAVKREVVSGRLKPGDALPSLRGLAADLMISLITVKRAYEELERDGVIYSRQGLGAFVAQSGLVQVREEKARVAKDALTTAVAAARSAGIGRDELAEMLEQQWIEGDKDGDSGD